MTVAIPCQRCGATFAAGNGALCPKCRGGFNPGEVRIPPHDPDDAIPMNDAAREARARQGLPPHPQDLGPGTTPEDLIRKLFGP